MRYDLSMIRDLCADVGFPYVEGDAGEGSIVLGDGLQLLFRNFDDEDDCVMGFEDFPWHSHGGITCVDPRGYYIELTYLDVITGLADGSVLVCELSAAGTISDRWLVHRDYFDEFRRMEIGDEIRVRRVVPGPLP